MENTVLPQKKSQNIYANKHSTVDPVERYLKKLLQPFETIRHEVELKILKNHIDGITLDCTIGTGRFISELKEHTKALYGMDYSLAFIDYVKSQHNISGLWVADLTSPLALKENSVDSIICLRSLSGIGSLETILPEMKRVTKVNGIIIIDYGRKKQVTKSSQGDIVTDGEDIMGIVKRLSLSIEKEYYVDGLFDRIKRYNKIYKLCSKILPFFPAPLFLLGDKIVSKFAWKRRIIILRKHDI